MLQRAICFLLLCALLACEPFDLTQKDFPVCAKPSAKIGVTADRLDVTFYLVNPQGDIGVAGWNPGDGRGINRVGQRVTYNYARAGEYKVLLTLANACDDRYVDSTRITVRN